MSTRHLLNEKESKEYDSTGQTKIYQSSFGGPNIYKVGDIIDIGIGESRKEKAEIIEVVIYPLNNEAPNHNLKHIWKHLTIKKCTG